MTVTSKDSSIFISVEAEDDSGNIIDWISSSVKLNFRRGWDNGMDDADVGRTVLRSILSCGWMFWSVMSLKLLDMVGFRWWRWLRWGKALPIFDVVVLLAVAADPSILLLPLLLQQLLLDIEELSPFPHRSRSFRCFRLCNVSLEMGMIGDDADTSRWLYSNVLPLLLLLPTPPPPPTPPTFFPASWETEGFLSFAATTEEGNGGSGGDDGGTVVVDVDDDEDHENEEDPGSSIDPFLSTPSQLVYETNEEQLSLPLLLLLLEERVWWCFCWCCIACDEQKDVWRDGGRDRIVETTNDDLALSGTTSTERFVGSTDISLRRPARNFPCDIVDFLGAYLEVELVSRCCVFPWLSFVWCYCLVLELCWQWCLFGVGSNGKKGPRQLSNSNNSNHNHNNHEFYKQKDAAREWVVDEMCCNCSSIHYSSSPKYSSSGQQECLWRLLLTVRRW